MGGWRSKQEADGLKKIEISWLRKNNFLEGSVPSTLRWTHSVSGEESGSVGVTVVTHGEEKYVRIYYTQTDRFSGEKNDFDYKIPLITTPCHFGGFRYWFRCPWFANGVYCGRRVGVLYLGGKFFACRHCYNLTYASRKLSGLWKMAGSVISMPELDEMEAKVKRKWYAGKTTRKYRSLLKKEEKSLRQITIVGYGLR